jgi:hypothetical protein
MLRKTANILLVTVFLSTSIGFSITQHYCGNTLVKISLGHIENCCPYCNKCHNKVNRIKITDSFNSISSNISLINPTVFLNIIMHSYDFLMGIIAPDRSIFADISPLPINFDNCFLQVFRN